MKLTHEDVEYVANLARIQITPAETEQLSHELSKILTYMEELNQIDTEGVAPMASVVSHVNVLREDEKRESLSQDKAVANAPAVKDGLFQVPKIISERQEPKGKTDVTSDVTSQNSPSRGYRRLFRV